MFLIHDAITLMWTAESRSNLALLIGMSAMQHLATTAELRGSTVDTTQPARSEAWIEVHSTKPGIWEALTLRPESAKSYPLTGQSAVGAIASHIGPDKILVFRFPTFEPIAANDLEPLDWIKVALRKAMSVRVKARSLFPVNNEFPLEIRIATPLYAMDPFCQWSGAASGGCYEVAPESKNGDVFSFADICRGASLQIRVYHDDVLYSAMNWTSPSNCSEIEVTLPDHSKVPRVAYEFPRRNVAELTTLATLAPVDMVAMAVPLHNCSLAAEDWHAIESRIISARAEAGTAVFSNLDPGEWAIMPFSHEQFVEPSRISVPIGDAHALQADINVNAEYKSHDFYTASLSVLDIAGKPVTDAELDLVAESVSFRKGALLDDAGKAVIDFPRGISALVRLDGSNLGTLGSSVVAGSNSFTVPSRYRNELSIRIAGIRRLEEAVFGQVTASTNHQIHRGIVISGADGDKLSALPDGAYTVYLWSNKGRSSLSTCVLQGWACNVEASLIDSGYGVFLTPRPTVPKSLVLSSSHGANFSWPIGCSGTTIVQLPVGAYDAAISGSDVAGQKFSITTGGYTQIAML